MASQTWQLFFDLNNRRLVSSPTGGVFVIPNVTDVDQIEIQLQLLALDPTASSLAPYQIVDPSGIAVTVAIGTTSTIYASQDSFTVEGQTLVGLLDLNTSNMVTAMTGVSQIQALFAIQTSDGDGRYTVQKTITIDKSIIRPGTPATVPSTTYLTRAECLALFARKIGLAGESITITSADGTKQTILYTDNDGSFHADGI